MALRDTMIQLVTDADKEINARLARLKNDLAAVPVDPIPVPVPPAPVPVPPPTPPPLPPPPPVPPTDKLIQAGNVKHVSTIRVPSGADLEYGGWGLAYNPARHSLFTTGHNYRNRTVELSIPTSGTAQTLQGPSDAFGGKIGQIGGDGQIHVGGYLVVGDQLHLSAYRFYDAAKTQRTSQFVRPVNLSSGSVTGPSKIGTLNPGFYSGYMAHVPPEHQAALRGSIVLGNGCLSIISRTSFGPGLFSMNPIAPNTAVPLVYYDEQYQTLDRYGASGVHPKFSGATRLGGVVIPAGWSSVLFLGRTGLGNYHYGDPQEDGFSDPADGNKGEHAYPYRPYVWAYRVSDLADVAAGRKQPWDVQPYATWELNMPLSGNAQYRILGAALDRDGKLYVTQWLGAGELPLIQIFDIK